MLSSPIHASYPSHSPQPGYHHHHAQNGNSNVRLSWDGFNGYSRMPGGNGGSGGGGGNGNGNGNGGDPGNDDAEPKARYELAPAESAQIQHASSSAVYGSNGSSMPRVQENTASVSSSSSLAFGEYLDRDADGRFLSYSDPQRWYYTNQQAVG